ncbi:lysophosphatidic acid receptor 6-like [Antedon mediterranea]|uniref:lysophosphatidic acid receptor 6-like n=1 Tax=Antedon mediterranea TaxID=105859 RepID=UPI003AF692A7
MANHTDYEKNVLHSHPAVNVIRYTVGIVGIFANLLVVLVFLTKKIYKKSSTHLVIFHQSWIDMAGSLLFVIYYTRDPPVGVAGEVFCKSRTLFWYLQYASTTNLVLVTIERYVAVLHSNWYRMKFSRRKRKEMILIIPHFTGVFMASYLVLVATIDEDKPWLCYYDINSSGRWFQVGSGVFVFLISWFIPTTLMIYCYARIFNMIRNKSNIEISRGQTEPTNEIGLGLQKENRKLTNTAYSRVQQNLIVTLFCVFIAFIITITPNIVLYVTYLFCNCFELNSSNVHEVTVTLIAVNLSVNPFIYSFKFNDFRKGLYQLRDELLAKVGIDMSEATTTKDDRHVNKL